jgi:2-amino-4-hydroxy-6-hydroxymethyldihydropteridine diphosphokinase
MNRIYLGLGSNVGDKINNIKQAIHFFNWDQRFEDLKTSSFYITEPYGDIPQDKFINAAISFTTSLPLDTLLIIIKELEKRIGRVKRKTWGPREIDIDILLADDIIINNESLVIPHRDILNRDFVIVPILEIDDEIIEPVSKKKLKLFLSDLKDKYIIDRINFNIKDLDIIEET